jgi:DNA mismatch repair protein PMS2
MITDGCSLEVRFKNQGLDSIEVHDNGAGISPQNYETVALKHYTSKLKTYSDLTTLNTFGFRGEALSSLCALSNFAITTCTAEEVPKGTKLEFEISGKLKGTTVVAAQKGTTVTVENLFNNLPVRRRELERNIKREWNRVNTVLAQYACIQTGVKITVTQQPTKGKKTTVFATKGNPTTRENIVNVFGAKTLTALLPLDLKLELEHTSRPSQRWSTQEDGDSKLIRITGHISHPVSGEGRQTPDKQMFFVNSRPCGLPQVSKVFNEVYKSYNSSQSPFIFANIELDTHFYDVNVSPDKRTILLHEQSRMLEELKVNLTEMFEKQDYTVPISQIAVMKQPSYKQLTINREAAKTYLASAAANGSVASMEDEGQPSCRRKSETTEENVDSDEEIMPRTRNAAAVSRDSMNCDGAAMNLVSNWAGRDAENRKHQSDSRQRVVSENSNGLSKDKMRLVEKFGHQDEVRSASNASSEDPKSTRASPEPPGVINNKRDEDFNKHMAEPTGAKNKSSDALSRLMQARTEPPIPAIASAVRRTTSGVNSLVSKRSMPRRVSEEIPEITIDGNTISSSIGTPCPKRQRVETLSTAKRSRGTPSFGGRLGQRFAAPGTMPKSNDEPSSNEDNLDEDTQNVEGESSPSGNEASAQGEIISDDDIYFEAEKEAGNLDQSSKIDIPPMAEGSSILSVDDDSDGEYIDEEEKKAQEDAKVEEMIKAAEESKTQPSENNAKRATQMLKGGARGKNATVHLMKTIDTTVQRIEEQLKTLTGALRDYEITKATEEDVDAGLSSQNPEEKLSLTIHKTDFAKMKIIGQFNLGFILATRTSAASSDEPSVDDNVFIIDQHASDEKYNFERLQATTIVQSQPLVRPKTLDLTAVEEEIVIENLAALEANGFIVRADTSGDVAVGQRCQLFALPLSRETTFSLQDLEELISLLAESSGSASAAGIVRPSKVRKMFAMRACRSSVMIGKTLTQRQMGKLVAHMGEIDKPWNCPHGRPTMRHLCGLSGWDRVGWREGCEFGEFEERRAADWATWIRENTG